MGGVPFAECHTEMMMCFIILMSPGRYIINMLLRKCGR